MRYLHQDAAGISKHVASLDLSVQVCSNNGTSAPSATSVHAIEEMLKASDLLFGLVLDYYLTVSKSAQAKCLPLAEAVSAVEASASSEEFLIVAYQDGGVISVSGIQHLFQRQASAAQWWRPWTGSPSASAKHSHALT
jgi:hypothetical protein